MEGGFEMAGEKYIVTTAENPLQIAIRNLLNPCGYNFLGNCYDAISLMRLIRSYHPDFIVVELSTKQREFQEVLTTVDEEMLCSCVVIGEYKDMEGSNLLEKSKAIHFCPKPLNREIFIHTVEMGNIYYKRIYELDRKLKEMTENYETRKAVERAKWILMQRDSLGENDAYERMRKKSMDNRMSMKAIAEAIIFTHELGMKK